MTGRSGALGDRADITVLVLDAMGVIYQVGEDVDELLVPFVRDHGGLDDVEAIAAAYREASLGTITAEAFWCRVGLDPALEDSYLAGHRLAPGLVPFLDQAREAYRALWCLSNDIECWSKKLRVNHDIERFFDGFLISSEVGLRKPDPAIYRALEMRLGPPPGPVDFVDDRAANLEAAVPFGWRTFLFQPAGPASEGAHRHLSGFDGFFMGR